MKREKERRLVKTQANRVMAIFIRFPGSWHPSPSWDLGGPPFASWPETSQASDMFLSSLSGHLSWLNNIQYLVHRNLLSEVVCLNSFILHSDPWGKCDHPLFQRRTLKHKEVKKLGAKVAEPGPQAREFGSGLNVLNTSSNITSQCERPRYVYGAESSSEWPERVLGKSGK